MAIGGAEAKIAWRILYRNAPNLDTRYACFVAFRAALANAWAAWLLQCEAEQAASMWLPELHPRYRPGITRGH
jgi:hypothetical protein